MPVAKNEITSLAVGDSGLRLTRKTTDPHPDVGLLGRRETADDYRAVIATLSDCWRVIVCRDALQWIVQRTDGERAGRARWTGVHYCQTRRALVRLCRASCERIDPGTLTVLGALPDVIGRAAQ